MLYTFETIEDEEIVHGKIEALSEQEAVDKVRKRQYTKENIITRRPKDSNTYSMIGVWLE